MNKFLVSALISVLLLGGAGCLIGKKGDCLTSFQNGLDTLFDPSSDKKIFPISTLIENAKLSYDHGCTGYFEAVIQKTSGGGTLRQRVIFDVPQGEIRNFSIKVENDVNTEQEAKLLCSREIKCLDNDAFTKIFNQEFVNYDKINAGRLKSKYSQNQ